MATYDGIIMPSSSPDSETSGGWREQIKTRRTRELEIGR